MPRCCSRVDGKNLLAAAGMFSSTSPALVEPVRAEAALPSMCLVVSLWGHGAARNETLAKCVRRSGIQ